MYVLKGFANHALLANNTPGTNNAIGEISQLSLTYSQELGQYVNSVAPDITLISFLSALNGAAQAVDPTFATRTFTILEWIYNLALTESGQMFADVFLQAILTQFQGVAESFQCGAIVVDVNGHYIPEWVSWQDTGAGTPTPNFVRIWFDDASFQAQYDEYTIAVVPPITPLDDFFKTASAVATEVDAVTYPSLVAAVQAARGNFPETILEADTFNYIDPDNLQAPLPTNWTVLIYGIAGNNIDAVKLALQTYILANSTHTRAEWTVIFPDIFKTTEFTLIPMWNQFAIPDRIVETGIYSPVANLVEVTALINQYASTYAPGQITAHSTVFGHPYKSLAVACIGSDQNLNNQFEITDVFPDFIAVSSTSTDFARMSQTTQTWAELLMNLLIQAEMYVEYGILPAGMTSLVRNNLLYVVASYNNINYLVAALSNFTTPA